MPRGSEVIVQCINMSEVTEYFESDNEQALREQIQAALASPVFSLNYLSSFFDGEYIPPEETIVLPDLTIQKAEAFYGLIKSELAAVEGEMHISNWLKQSMDPSTKKQTTFDHELTHIRSASELGVDLQKSRIDLLFMIDGFGLQLTHSFHPPENTDPVVKLQIALAPEEPSISDIAVVQKVLRECEEPFEPEQMQKFGTLILQKTGKNIAQLLKD